VSKSTVPLGQFDITPYTKAPLRMEITVEYEGKTREEVFAIIGDPELIPEWYLLAKRIIMHPSDEDGEASFKVEFTLFGEVYEEVLHWDEPNRYVYLAKGNDLPIKGYTALIEVFDTEPCKGVFVWKIYYDAIEGEEFQKLLPVILPPIKEESIRCLLPYIGGTRYDVKSYL